MRKFGLIGAALLTFALGGCLGAHNRTTTGAVVGGTAGAVVGGVATGTVTGAAVGGVIGAGTGALLAEVTRPRRW